MKDTKIRQSADRIDIKERVGYFMDKISTIDQTSRAYANAITTEKRFMKKHYPALRTLSKIYLEYRKKLETSGDFHHSFDKARAKLIKKHKEIEGVLNGKNAKEVMDKIKKYCAAMDDRTTGLYDSLRALKVAPKAYYTFLLTKGERSTIGEADKLKVVESKKDKIEINREVVKNAIKEGLLSKSMYRQAIALSLCIGRRPVEIFKTASFSYESKYSVYMTGQAKGKVLDVVDDYEIPVMHMTARQFLKAFEAFRKQTLSAGYDKITNKQVNNRIASDISRVARLMLKNEFVTAYTCRSIYAQFAIETAKDKKVDTQVYIASILGHSKDDIKTALSYEGVVLTDEAPKEQSGVREKRAERLPLGVKSSKEAKTKKETKQESKRIKELEKLNVSELGKAAKGLHTWVLEHLKECPDAVLTQTYIARNRQTSRPAIKKYLAFIGELAGHE